MKMVVVKKHSAFAIVEAVTVGEARWMGTPEEEVNGIYDAIEENGEFVDHAAGVVYVLAAEG
jgi:hypothetical protein